jgi:hypothetical protein
MRDGERNSGVGHTARVFRSIPPFRLALRSVPVGTPRTPVFPPLWVRTLLSARPAEARPNPSTSSVHPCISSGGRGSEREGKRKRERERNRCGERDERGTQRATRGTDRWIDTKERVYPRRVDGCRNEGDKRKGENEAAQAARGGATLRGFR